MKSQVKPFAITLIKYKSTEKRFVKNISGKGQHIALDNVTKQPQRWKTINNVKTRCVQAVKGDDSKLNGNDARE